MSDPVIDNKIAKGNVVMNERGLLFVAIGRFRKSDGTTTGWHGIAFNGVPIRADFAELVAPSINAYITDTYGRPQPVDAGDNDNA
jgi:hypothetical protein